MNAEKLRDRSKSLALKTLAAVELIEHRIASGETGAALTHASEQLRGAVESLLALAEPPTPGQSFLDTDTKSLTAHLDSRVGAIEQQIVAMKERS
jgi:hypothetical protein